MIILKASIFEQYPGIIFGFSTKIDAEEKKPYYFNLSFSVGDDQETVTRNRELFFESLGIKGENIAFQKQVHGDLTRYIQTGGMQGESDAMITDKRNIGLAINTADCTPIFIYDKKNKIISGVHSGWRSSEKKILEKTLFKLKDDFNSSPENLVVYIGPSISKDNYEVGKEVADLFDSKFKVKCGEKFLLDVAGVNYDMLIKFGVKKENIQKSSLCTYEAKYLLHSYRRDGERSGRALGIITMKGSDENNRY